MATDDVTRHKTACPCGLATITFTTSSPDHPWARASQTTYSAKIDCMKCRENYVVQQDSSNEEPVIVYREEVGQKRKIRVEIREREEAVVQSREGAALRRRIVSSIDNEESMAGKHRELKQYGLVHVTYGTYRKRPYGGDEAMRFAGGMTLAKIGAGTDLGGEDKAFFVRELDMLERMQRSEEAIRIRVVKLGV